MKIERNRALILMAFGVGAGLLSGMFGLGGGIVIVPGLMFALKMDQRLAHGTSLAGVLPISMASILTYWAHDHIDWGVTLWLTIGSVGGALIGARLLAVLPKRVLTLTFVAVLAIAGVRMFFEIDTSGVTVIDAGSAIALVVIGFFGSVGWNAWYRWGFDHRSDHDCDFSRATCGGKRYCTCRGYSDCIKRDSSKFV